MEQAAAGVGIKMEMAARLPAVVEKIFQGGNEFGKGVGIAGEAEGVTRIADVNGQQPAARIGADQLQKGERARQGGMGSAGGY